ncbi:hypothetical protein EON80_31855, partial [bacterium]
MKIRKCPDCAQLVHFEPAKPVRRCYHCGAYCDLSHLPISPQKQISWLLRGFDARLPQLSSLKRIGQVALVLALPISTFMMLA